MLGGLLLDTSAWDSVADMVRAPDFYRPDHRLIFEAIGALAGQAKPCDVITVSEQLLRLGKLDDAGGLAYLGTLARDTPTAANVRAYAEIVRERSLLRQLIEAGTQIAGSVFNTEGHSARELVDKAEQKVFEIAEAGFRARDGAVAVRAMLPALIDKIDDCAPEPGRAAGASHRLHRFRQGHGWPAARRSRDRRRSSVDGQDHACREHGRVRGREPQAQVPPSPSSAWKCRRSS